MKGREWSFSPRWVIPFSAKRTCVKLENEEQTRGSRNRLERGEDHNRVCEPLAETDPPPNTPPTTTTYICRISSEICLSGQGARDMSGS